MKIVTAQKLISSKGFKAALGVFVVKILQVFLGLALTVLVSRTVGVDGLGVYASVYSLSTIIAVLVSGGLCVFIMRELPVLVAKENSEKIEEIGRACSIVSKYFFVFSMFMVLILYISMGGSPYLFIWIIAPFLYACRVRSSLVRAFGYTVESQIEMSVVLLFTITILVIATFIPYDLQPMHVFGVMGFSFFAVSLNRKERSNRLLVVGVNKNYEKLDARMFPEYSTIFSLGLVVLVQVVLGESGVLALQIVGSNEDIGVYKAVNDLSGVVGIVFIVLNIVFTKQLSIAIKQTELRLVDNLVKKCAMISSVFAVTLSVPLLVYPNPLIEFIYGHEFTVEGSKVIVWLVVAQVVNCLLGPVMLMSTLTDCHNKMILPLVIGFLSSLSISIVAYSAFGVEGVSMGVLAGVFIWKTAVSYRLYKYENIRLGFFSIISKREE